ncbi:large subunit GTPase 1 family protein [bacterium]|nr:large subunit GTPase 1 family protein [bacterium]
MERNDLDEFLAMAELGDRDFTAERRGAVVVSMADGTDPNADPNMDQHELAVQKKQQVAIAEATHRDKLKVPRRPPWTKDMHPEVLDQNERRSFLEWRRALAMVEEDERLTLTPFEKNLEIWRQLWRVCERSDIVVQVVDARDPLFYRCIDLEAFVKELDPGKKTMLLLNKSDLLSVELRNAWSEYFDANGIEYLWWSAKAATEQVELTEKLAKQEEAANLATRAARIDNEFDEEYSSDASDAEASGDDVSGDDDEAGNDDTNVNPSNSTNSNLLAREDLLAILEARAEEAAGEGARDRRRDGRVVVGMVGYPNVGKSSTVNALVAKKKTGVSATPGKTKHFQTLELGDGLLLADCPGLVFPSFTASRAELVCNGVLPIDRLTDVRQPVSIVAERISRHLIERVYKMKLPLPALHEDQNRNATAGEILRAYSAARGLTVQHGRPDEQRAGRAVLKDFINGKLLFCVGPEGYDGPMGVAGDAIITGDENLEEEEKNQFDSNQPVHDPNEPNAGTSADWNATVSAATDVDGISPDDPLAKQLFQEMMSELGIGKQKPEKQKRAEHKFQKKSKVKGRIKNKGYGEDHTAGGDGFKMGKKGGMMPASVQATVRSAITDE